MTLGEFRTITNKLIDTISPSQDKDSFSRFLKIDLTFIDTAKTIRETLELKKEVSMEKMVAVIQPDGRINWVHLDEANGENLIIGHPIKRTEYYSEIVKLMNSLISK